MGQIKTEKGEIKKAEMADTTISRSCGGGFRGCLRRGIGINMFQVRPTISGAKTTTVKIHETI
jgi:hypothetical protein